MSAPFFMKSGVSITPPMVSIGIIAWNEEGSIQKMLESVFAQTLFAGLARRGQSCEIVCVTNGCTDKTPGIVAGVFARHTKSHPQRSSFRCCLFNVQERGKYNAWNLFVSSLSHRQAEYLFLMDADIVLQQPETLWNMLTTLQRHGEAHVATDEPVKDIALKPRRSFSEWLSLRASATTQAAGAQLTGQLYCIRAAVARRIYIPRELPSCEDGFIKALVCTDFLSHEVWPCRIVRAANSSHAFEAYTRFRDVFKNQKRQILGQTVVHILLDRHLKSLPLFSRLYTGQTLRLCDRNEPAWLRRLIADHLRQTKRFWRLYPQMISLRFRRLWALPGLQKLLSLPAAMASSVLMLAAAWAAHRAFKSGAFAYWPGKTSAPVARALRPAMRVTQEMNSAVYPAAKEA